MMDVQQDFFEDTVQQNVEKCQSIQMIVKQEYHSVQYDKEHSLHSC